MGHEGGTASDFELRISDFETGGSVRGFPLHGMKFPVLLAALAATAPLAAQEDVAPTTVVAEDFSALKGQSPFLRSLNLSDLLILTGVAEVEGERVATVMNKETKETYVVSTKANSQGWKMVEMKSDGDLETVAAKIAIDGGEVVTVRYAEFQLKPGESKPAAGPSTEPNGGPTAIMAAGRRGGRSERRGPPPEIREKMDRLSEDQRRQLFDQMRELRERNPFMTREESGKAFGESLDRMLKQK